MRRLIVTTSASLDGSIEGRRNTAIETWRSPFSDMEFERLARDQVGPR